MPRHPRVRRRVLPKTSQKGFRPCCRRGAHPSVRYKGPRFIGYGSSRPFAYLSHLPLAGRPDLHAVLTKLHVFRLTQFSKIIFLDADVLPIRPLSHLFTLPHDFSAVPDVGWPDIFNSGVLVFNPGEEKFNGLMDLLHSKGSWDGGDQGILNEWRGNNWNRLSFIYNTTPTAAYTYAPAYERFGSQISAIHFIGHNKPWNAIPYRPPFTKFSTVESSELAYDYNSLVDRWFNVYDQHYRAQPIMVDSSFELKKYIPVWEEQSRDERTATVSALPLGATFSMEELKKVAIDGLHSLVSSSGDREGEGEGEGKYIKLPLEGRVDLMRPKRPQDLVLPDETDVADAGSKSEHAVPVEIRMQESVPSTPPRKPLDNSESFGWQSLPTPDPRDFPPGPRPQIISLPSTPTPHAWFAQSSPSPRPTQMSMFSLHPTQTLLPSLHPTQVFPSLLHPVPSSPQPSRESSSSLHPVQASLSPLRQVHALSSSVHPEGPSFPQLEQMVAASSDSGQVPMQPIAMPIQMAPSSPQPTETTQDYFSPHQSTQAPLFTEKQEPLQIGSHAKEEERRPPSPPLLLWNPAIEPPPTTLPSSSAFPADTYYPNAWDRTQTKSTGGTSQSQDTAQLFQPPPTPGIPKPLVQEGHYRQVTGDSASGAAPSPDPTKVKHVFTWEDKPRAQPSRIFPSLESPSPKQVRGPSIPPLAMSPGTAPLSPLRGLPVNLAYANKWDIVPGIQKYASRLRPPKALAPLAPAFDENEWKKSPESKAEVSSRDGDDEDSSDGSVVDDSDRDERSSRNTQKQSRRSSVVSASELITGKKKQYKTRGVQTVPKDMRSRAVQVNTFLINPSIVSKTRNQSSSAGTPDVSQQPDLPLSTAMPSPVDEHERPLQTPRPRSSSEQKLPMPERFMSQLPIHVPRLGSPSIVSRQVSNDSSLASPASSGPPLSPTEGPVPQSPSRKGGRVWDPARGVELFKRGSEEVLARFLKMGSWENEGSRLR
ncbi:hypothetical protein AX14_013434 [Amanita brunnescens Koide BX004]|nr:hypothetical protein AX14_013434 [Amanita brunnescens Koide BX004]